MMHTKEPWVATNIPMSGRIVCVVPHEDSQANDWFILVPGKRGSTEDDARRIVACVNALAGMNPGAVGDVVEAFQELYSYADEEMFPRTAAVVNVLDKAKAALAKLEAAE